MPEKHALDQLRSLCVGGQTSAEALEAETGPMHGKSIEAVIGRIIGTTREDCSHQRRKPTLSSLLRIPCRSRHRGRGRVGRSDNRDKEGVAQLIFCTRVGFIVEFDNGEQLAAFRADDKISALLGDSQAVAMRGFLVGTCRVEQRGECHLRENIVVGKCRDESAEKFQLVRRHQAAAPLLS